ncbi:MAG: GTPase Era [Saprospiraceae bacterium]|nr:GTPase Era [Saprospiraceae bacterium]
MPQSGFVSIIGLPNSGKSTLVNALSEGKLSIVSPKPQTTRQRVFSIVTKQDMQIIYSDTPGWILDAKYPLHQLMNERVFESFTDADLILLLIDGPVGLDDFTKIHNLTKKINHLAKLVVINKMDLMSPSQIEHLVSGINKMESSLPVFVLSAKTGTGLNDLRSKIEEMIPEHPFYFPEDIISDKPIRFFISELIREQIMYQYKDEIPYSIFVEVTSCKGVDESLPLAKIEATIHVAKESQVSILLGKAGSKIKALGIGARIEIEKFLGQKVYLGLSVKLKKDWRNNPDFIEKSGILR